MKHIKTFEITVTTRFREEAAQQETTVPQKGEFVIATDYTDTANKKIIDFLHNNVGQIGIILHNEPRYKYRVRYKNVPDDIKHYFATGVDDFCRVDLKRNEILFHSPNKNEVTQFILNSKFNL